MELINMYPTDCIVRLSNGKQARVRSVNENQPYRPIIEEIGTSRIYELPLNFSVTIISFIRWDQIADLKLDDSINKQEIYWHSFINQLINGDMEKAVNYYQMVTEGMSSNNIFIDVIIRSIKEVESKRMQLVKKLICYN